MTTPDPQSPGCSPQTTWTLYSKMLQATNVVNPDGTGVTNIYLLTGELGQTLGSRTYPVAYAYDYAGRMKTMQTWQNYPSSGSALTTWYYDLNRGFLTNKVYNDGKGPLYSYTPAGRLQTRTWARGVTTTYGYGNDGSLSTVAYSDGTPGVSYAYDRLGRQASITQNGITTALAYNLAGEVLGETYSGGTLAGLSVTNGFDTLMRRTNLTALGSTVLLQDSFTFDNASRLQTASAGGAIAFYSYLTNSDLVGQIQFTNGGVQRMTTTRQYDFLSRLRQISSTPSASSAVAITYSYNNANQRTQIQLRDGSYWRFAYDWLGQLTSGHKYFADETPVAGQQFDYAFDTIGNLTQAKAGGDSTGGNQRLANYYPNLLNQYTNRDVPGAVDVMGASIATNTVTVNGQTAYRKGEYFRQQLNVNNTSAAVWTNITVSATGQSSQSGNRLVPKTQEQFLYDYDGNLTNDGRWGYTWDAENRLVSLAANSSVGPQISLKFEYDSRGRRIRNQVWPNTNWSGSATNDLKFLYDRWNLLAELNTLNSALRTYMWGLDLSGQPQGAGGVGGLLEAVYVGSQTTNAFAAFDGNGNVAALVNAADGTTVAQYEYGPFGELLRSTGPMAKANPFRFSTKYQDGETDSVYYGYRHYNASPGRWLSRDPIAERGGGNLYAFARNNPITLIDRLGLASYQIVNLDPTGWWGVTLANVDVPGGLTWRGFHSRYLPSDGRNGHPPCPCKKENIFLAQAIYDATHRPAQFDVWGYGPGDLPAHKADDPIPGYYWTSQPSDPLTIVDAPNTSGATGTWVIEDCAVCRTHPTADSVLDQVMGCVKFVFHRINDNEAELTVEGGHNPFVAARSPGKLWGEALESWRKRAN